ncbi:hypothetical protein RB195_022091 [Necator americanus]|uniref:Uncharacterized protein n=1 Tax=Necator americanus TaxID=51031 RepID=A0ABR1EDY1_NECAM
MSSTLKGKQAWLTRQGTQLSSTILKIEEFLESAETLPAAEANVRTRKAIKELDLRQTALEKAMNNYTSAADAADLAEEHQKTTMSNITTAQDTIIRAQNLLITLSLCLEDHEKGKLCEAEADNKVLPQIPPLQISKFRGNPWEWDQFWGIFNATIHDRKISKIEKFTHLLEALQGPARDTVQDLQITAENYDIDIVLDILKRRYGNEEAIVGHLLSKLQFLQQQSL